MMKSNRGFTVIELMVVLAAVGLLLSVAAPRYVQHLDRVREVALKENLRVMREAIDKFFADQGRYPNALEDLVVLRYLRAVPADPIIDRTDAWVLIPAPQAHQGKAADVRSGAPGKARDGSPYAQW